MGDQLRAPGRRHLRELVHLRPRPRPAVAGGHLAQGRARRVLGRPVPAVRPALRCLRQEPVHAQPVCRPYEDDLRRRQQRDVRLHRARSRRPGRPSSRPRPSRANSSRRTGPLASSGASGEPGPRARSAQGERAIASRRWRPTDGCRRSNEAVRRVRRERRAGAPGAKRPGGASDRKSPLAADRWVRRSNEAVRRPRRQFAIAFAARKREDARHDACHLTRSRRGARAPRRRRRKRGRVPRAR